MIRREAHEVGPRARKGVRVTLCFAVALAGLVLGSCRARPSGPVAIVLGGEGTSRVWTVDLSRHKVLSRVDLRSYAGFCDLGPDGRVVSAQCGGLGSETDNVAAVIERGSDRVRYVPLKTTNPFDVAVADGCAVIMHGFERPSGMVSSSFEVASGKFLAEGSLPPGPQRLGTSAGRILLTAAPPAEGAAAVRSGALYEISPRTLRATKICDTKLGFGVPIPDPRSTATTPTALVVGFADGSSVRARASTSELVRIDLRSGRPLERKRLRGLRAGAFEASADGSTLAVLDSATAEPTVEDAVAIFDLATAEPLARVANGSPGGIAVAGDEILVADLQTGVLKHYSRWGSLLGTTEVGELGVSVDLEVQPSGTSASRSRP